MFSLNAATTGLTSNPASLTFTYQMGGALPVTQNVSLASGGVTANFTVTITGGPWLTVVPSAGKTPGTLIVSVNPATLPLGSYSGTVTVTPSGGLAAIQIPVTLIVKAAVTVLSVVPVSLNPTYQIGDPVPLTQTLSISSSEGLASFTVQASGGTWISVSPASGVVFLAFPAQLTVTIDPSSLVPGSYSGAITISSTTASPKTQTIPVTLTVNPGKPVLSSVWPGKIPMGSADTVLTVTGTGFYSGSAVKANATPLTMTFLGSTALLAVLPGTMLKAAGDISVIVSNPPPGGGDSKPFTVTVQTPGPHITAAGIVNAASYAGGAVAPGEMLAVFGSAIGPDTPTSFIAPSGTGAIATSLGGAQVIFDSVPVPVIFAESGQLVVMAPYALAGKTFTHVNVQYNTTASETVTMLVADAAPALFTLGAAGTGQCAALNYDATTQAYTINSDTNPATASSVVVLYAMGAGQTKPAGIDGIITAAANLPVPVLPVTVQIGGLDATVLSATAGPGLVAGIMQVNVQVPTGIKANKTVPVVLKVGTFSSPAGTTIALK